MSNIKTDLLDKFSDLRAEYLSKHDGAQDPLLYLSIGLAKLISIMENAKGKKIVFTPIKGTTGGQKITYE